MEDSVGESAKALQETAKATAKGIDLIRDAGSWLGDGIGKAINEAIGLYITDPISVKRFERAIYSKDRLAALERKLGDIHNVEPIVIRSIPPKVSIPLLEKATMEFDEDLHTLWANLLATAMDAKHDVVETKHVSILSELSATDAKILSSAWVAWRKIGRHSNRRGVATFQNGISFIDKADISNLKRLELLQAAEITLNVPDIRQARRLDGEQSLTISENGGFRVQGSEDVYVVTLLGEAFCKAVGLDSV